MIRVLVVDDHDLVRQAVSALLDDAGDITVVGQCADGGESVQAAARIEPDVVLMDLSMPVLDGFEATREVIRAHPPARVVILTSTLSCTNVHRARQAGAVGYQLKTAPPAKLVRAVRDVAQGGTGWDERARHVLGN